MPDCIYSSIIVYDDISSSAGHLRSNAISNMLRHKQIEKQCSCWRSFWCQRLCRYYGLKPDIKVISPWREWDLTSRSTLIQYAESRGIEVPSSKRGEPPFSMDANLLHISYEGWIASLHHPLRSHFFHGRLQLYLHIDQMLPLRILTLKLRSLGRETVASRPLHLTIFQHSHSHDLTVQDNLWDLHLRKVPKPWIKQCVWSCDSMQKCFGRSLGGAKGGHVY